MKVLLIYHAGVKDHAVANYKELAKHVDLDVVVPTIFFPRHTGRDLDYLRYDPKQFTFNSFNVTSIPLNDSSNAWGGFVYEQLKNKIKLPNSTIDYDIIHVIDEVDSGILRQVLRIKNETKTIAKVLFYGYENVSQGNLKEKLGRLYDFLDGGVVCSDGARRVVCELGHIDKPVKKIYWGIDNQFNKIEGIDKLIKEKSGNKINIAYVGRLSPEKGVKLLCDSYLKLYRSDVSLHIVGSGPQYSLLKEQYGKRVIFWESRSKDFIRSFLNYMDLLVVPSITTREWKEQYGKVIIEGFLSNTIVIGSDSGAIPEIIGDYPSLIFREGDIDSLIKCIKANLQKKDNYSLLNKAIIADKQFDFEKKFSCKAMAEQFVSFYKDILHG